MITFYPYDQQKLFTNRDYELAQLSHLVHTLETGPAEHAALFGLRRIGKTLLLKEFMRRLLLTDSAILPVYMDFSTLASSPENFALGYAGLVCHWILNRGEGDAGPFLSSASLPGALMRGEGTWLYPLLEPLLRELEKARPDRQALLRAAFHFPQQLVESSQSKLILIFDEFQEIRTLTRFPDSQNILALLRSEMQSQSGILYLLAGSAISVLMGMLSDPESPLFAQFSRLPIEPFDREATGLLADRLTTGQAGADLLPLIHNLAKGHPFYITAICRRLMNLVEAVNRPMEAETVKQAFLIETLVPYGRIYDFCRYVYDLSLQKAAGYGVLKAVLQILSTEEGLTTSQIARQLRVTPASASDYIRWLREVDLLTEREHRFYFRDPVLRFWVANTIRGIELGLTTEPLDMASLITRLDSQFQRTSEELGVAQESAVRELMRRFDGQEIDGAIFNALEKILLPRFERVESYLSEDGQTQLDALSETAQGEKWIVEVKWRNRRVGAKEVERLSNLARGLDAQGWLISRSGFTNDALKHARKIQVLLTDREGLRELRRLIEQG
jgi:AAA+ ATPase superfamily predicted ATPase